MPDASRAEAPRERPAVPARVTADVLSVKQVGAYRHLTVVADHIARQARAGSFLTFHVGGDSSALLRPRPLWVHQVRSSGVYGGTLEVIVDPRGAGTRWLAGLHPHDRVDVTGPLGRPFALPREPVACAIVGDGYGAAPLFMLAERLRERECAVHMVLGADDEPHLVGALAGRRGALSMTVCTRDGSVGIKGTVQDALPAILERHRIDVVFACGPDSTLAAVAERAAAGGAWSQVALEREMSCGVGLCMSCMVSIRGRDDRSQARRVCYDGPIFAGDRVEWDQPAADHTEGKKPESDRADRELA